MLSNIKFSPKPSEGDENCFVEFRRKMKFAEILSSSMEQLLRSMNFTGKVNLCVQNGRVSKANYEEGYFRQRPGM